MCMVGKTTMSRNAFRLDVVSDTSTTAPAYTIGTTSVIGTHGAATSDTTSAINVIGGTICRSFRDLG